MFKKEWIYRELACLHLKERGAAFTELSLSRKFGISLCTVHHALVPLKEMGIVTPLSRGWRVVAFGKLLAFWASTRRLGREIIWEGNAPSVREAERLAPSGTVWGGFTAYKLRYKETPADYSVLVLYADEKQLGEIKERLERGKGGARILVLKKDQFILDESQDGLCTDPQIYADLWNMKEWYAADFRRALEKQMGIDGME